MANNFPLAGFSEWMFRPAQSGIVADVITLHSLIACTQHEIEPSALNEQLLPA